MSYRESDSTSDRPKVVGPRFIDDDERRFWETMACAMESCSTLTSGGSRPTDYAKRCDAWILLRRERLATTERP